jgi:hypothetical protein
MKYFILINNEQRGPFEIKDLKDNGLTSASLVWTDGMAQWMPAWQVKELRYILNEPGSVPPEPPKPEEPKPSEPEQKPSEPEPEPIIEPQAMPRPTFGIKSVITVIALALIIIIMAITTPDKRSHQDALKEVVMNVINDEVKTDDNMFEQGIRMVGNFFIGKIADSVLGEMLHVDNYVVVSVGTLNYNGKNHVVSVGIFNHVFTVNEKDVSKAIEKKKKEMENSDIMNGAGMINDLINGLTN